jgi:hypothetical protein
VNAQDPHELGSTRVIGDVVDTEAAAAWAKIRSRPQQIAYLRDVAVDEAESLMMLIGGRYWRTFRALERLGLVEERGQIAYRTDLGRRVLALSRAVRS